MKLDVYEGMWHAFPQYGSPESKVAVEKSAEFINDHLHQGTWSSRRGFVR